MIHNNPPSPNTPHATSKLPLDLGLAPMEGVSDFPVRLWFAMTSPPQFMGTPFLRLSSAYPKSALPIKWCPEILHPDLIDFSGLPYQVIPQFMAPRPEFFITAADKILTRTSMVELNCGCPSPKAVGKGAGSSILANHDDFHRFTKIICCAIGAQHLGIKIRTGYDSSTNFTHILQAIQDQNLHHLTVHGRSKAQGYQGNADWRLINEAAKSLEIPVTGSGDVLDVDSLTQKLSQAPTVKGVIVGRGALRNPWVFELLSSAHPVSVDRKVLEISFASLALLHELFTYKFDTLIASVVGGVCQEAGKNKIDSWERIYNTLNRCMHGSTTQLKDLGISRGSLGKTKMMWSYLRSSLPPQFFDPKILRAKTLGDMLTRIHAAEDLYCEKSKLEVIPIRWNKSYDWIYSGGKQTQE